jgi:2'-5' RNA ligase
VRLFAAVRPPADVLDHLDLALRVVRAGARGDDRSSPVRWTAEENRHLTVAFYGEVPGGGSDDLAHGLARVAEEVEPFELRLRGAGVFSHRTLWVGASGDVDAMNRLSARAVDAGADVGTRPDERVRSRPHLTVGRVDPSARPTRRSRRRPDDEPPSAQIDALVRALAVYEGPAWTVEELLLVESEPGAGRGGGPLYTTVDGWRLGGA